MFNHQAAALQDYPSADTFSVQLAKRLACLAHQQGANKEAVIWVIRLTYALSQSLAEGHTCLSLKDFANAYDSAVEDVIEQLLAERLLSRDPRDRHRVLFMVDEDFRSYFARYYDQEWRLANRLTTLSAAIEHLPLSTIQSYLKIFFPQQKSIDWQCVAAWVALNGRVTLISGGPGTGKTTTIAGVLACLLSVYPDAQVALAAPTGKAAQRMQEALLARAQQFPSELRQRMPAQALTLHRLLGQTGQGTYRYHRQAPLPYEVIIVDEASMMDLQISMHLFEALAPHARLILLGDKDQLSAVEAGTVFSELTRFPQYDAQFKQDLVNVFGYSQNEVEQAFSQLQQKEKPANNQAEPIEYRLKEEVVESIVTEALSLPLLKEYASDKRPLFAQQHHFSEKANHFFPLINRVVWLQKNYRFGAQSEIGLLSTAIKQGDVAQAMTLLKQYRYTDLTQFFDDKVIWHEETVEANDLNYQYWDFFIQAYQPYLNHVKQKMLNPESISLEQLINSFNTFRLLAVMRHGLRGTIHLNQVMSEYVMKALDLPLQLWYVGRPIMITQNDYTLGLFNGDIGLTLLDEDGKLKVYFLAAHNTVKKVMPELLPEHETAWAMTVHKSQGSEFMHIALMMPAQYQRVLSRELVYTALTRAKKSVNLISSQAVWLAAISQSAERDSGLLARLYGQR